MDRGELGAQARGFGRGRSRHRRGRKPAVVVGEFLVPGLKLFELTGEGKLVGGARGLRGTGLALGLFGGAPGGGEFGLRPAQVVAKFI